MNKNFRKVWAVSLAALWAAAVIGCSKGEDGGEASQSAEQIELDIMFMKNENIDILNQIAEDYMKENPDVKIIMQSGTKEQMPVSYTHLDVYKRQEYRLPPGLLLQKNATPLWLTSRLIFTQRRKIL